MIVMAKVMGYYLWYFYNVNCMKKKYIFSYQCGRIFEENYLYQIICGINRRLKKIE